MSVSILNEMTIKWPLTSSLVSDNSADQPVDAYMHLPSTKHRTSQCVGSCQLPGTSFQRTWVSTHSKEVVGFQLCISRHKQEDIGLCRIFLTSKVETTMRVKQREKNRCKKRLDKRKRKDRSGTRGCEARKCLTKVFPCWEITLEA